jgi:hypothetical protein
MTEGNSVQLSISNFVADLHEERKKWKYSKVVHQLTHEESLGFPYGEKYCKSFALSVIYAMLAIVKGRSSTHLFLFYSIPMTLQLD